MDLLQYYRQQKISLRYQKIETILDSLRGELPDSEVEAVDELETTVDGLMGYVERAARTRES